MLIEKIRGFFEMGAEAGLWLSVSILLVAVGVAAIICLARYKRARFWTIPRCLAVGIFVSAACYFFFYYFRLQENSALYSVFSMFWRTLQLYVLDGDAGNIDELLGCKKISDQITAELINRYRYYGYVLRILAPLTTFAFLLTFVKNIYAHFLYFFQKPWTDTHVFSELNEKSLALAENLKRHPFGTDAFKGKNIFVRAWYAFAGWIMSPTIVFTDVTDKREEENLEWVDKAKEIGAILFRKDLEAIRHKRYISRKRQRIYLISDDEPEKIRHTINIIEKCKKQSKVTLYVFSDKVESKTILGSHTTKELDEMRLEVVRVNDARALIYHNLEIPQNMLPDFAVLNQKDQYSKSNMGIRLFEKAKPVGDENREISAVIVGLGKYGIEMLKALLWYCQLPGYKIKITALDESEDIESRFKAMCPEIDFNVSPQHKPKEKKDMCYELYIKSVKVGTNEFLEEIKKIEDVTYFFVCLGQDDLNLSTAMMIENHMVALGRNPDIDTVVYNSDLAEQMRDKWEDDRRQKEKENENCSSCGCRIQIIGDLKKFYSADTILSEDLSNEALAVHLRWCDEETQGMTDQQKKRYEKQKKQQLYMDDYGYFSSLASALHRRLRSKILEYLDDSNKGDEYCLAVFPAFRRPNGNDDAKEQSKRKALRYVLGEINENDDIITLSKKMKQYGCCVYLKLGHMCYQALPDEEKDEMRKVIHKKLLERGYNENGAQNFIKAYEASPEEFVGLSVNIKDKDSKLVFDLIVEAALSVSDPNKSKSFEEVRAFKIDFEHKLLKDPERSVVATYVKQRYPDADFEGFMQQVQCYSELEHIRWNAYIRTEGFQTSKTKDTAHKLHPLIVEVDQLTLDEKVKDI